MNKVLGLSLFIAVLAAGCSNDELHVIEPSSRIGDEPTYVSAPSYEYITDIQLKEISRDLAEKYLGLKKEWDNKAFYEMGKEILMYEELFPSRGNYEEYKFDILNEKMVNLKKVKNVHYSFDLKETFRYQDGTVELTEDSVTFSIMQDKDGKYKIAFIL
ncbi:hypothetical protein QTG56_25095 (plasmid) [Rossellomorea sp. AcN35-11]|nr:hypothetical protein [Rossellomorea aquimaris]WJV31911.1 hypothetical protein QTG56_25095 [Rossellomorea sp. AcN35-11]